MWDYKPQIHFSHCVRLVTSSLCGNTAQYFTSTFTLIGTLNTITTQLQCNSDNITAETVFIATDYPTQASFKSLPIGFHDVSNVMSKSTKSQVNKWLLVSYFEVCE